VADFIEWKRQSKAFHDLHAQTDGRFNIATSQQPEYVDGRITTPGLYTMLAGPPFYLGRDFLPEEGVPGKDHVVILTHKFWQRLGSNPHILGTSLLHRRPALHGSRRLWSRPHRSRPGRIRGAAVFHERRTVES